MLNPKLFIDIQREVDLFAEALTVGVKSVSMVKGYAADNLYVRGYIEDKENPTDHSYYHEMLVPAMKAFANLISSANYVEFEELPVCKPGEGPIQVVGGGPNYGFWLRKTTEYKPFGILPEQCPEHVAKPEWGGYYTVDDKCPAGCNFIPKFKGLDPGYQTIYDVLIRSNPKLQIK